MAMIGDGEARKLGERLLLEVEVEELSAVCSNVTTESLGGFNGFFSRCSLPFGHW
jgi:hypothetical protein